MPGLTTLTPVFSHEGGGDGLPGLPTNNSGGGNGLPGLPRNTSTAARTGTQSQIQDCDYAAPSLLQAPSPFRTAQMLQPPSRDLPAPVPGRSWKVWPHAGRGGGSVSNSSTLGLLP